MFLNIGVSCTEPGFEPPHGLVETPLWSEYIVKKIFKAITTALDNEKAGLKVVTKTHAVTVYFIQYLGSFIHRQVNYEELRLLPLIFLRCIYDYDQVDHALETISIPGDGDEILALIMRLLKSMNPYLLPSLTEKLNGYLSDKQRNAPNAFTTILPPTRKSSFEDPKDDTILKACFNCKKERAGLCQQCESARYCSKFCQEQDWPRHKAVCFKC